MATSIRQQIIDALVTLLGTITTGNGYETSIGSNVFEWRTDNWQESEVPGVAVSDPDESVERKGIKDYHSLSISFEVKTSGSTSTTVFRDAIADIDKALSTDPTLGGLVQSMTPVDNESAVVEKADKIFASTTIKIIAVYRTAMFNPFTLS